MEEIPEDIKEILREQGIEPDYDKFEEEFIKFFLRAYLLTTDEQEIQKAYDDLKARKSDD
jgi:hypothetical protein